MTNSKKSFVAVALLLALSVSTVFGQGRGYDPANMDRNTSACADFYQYSNGTWLNKTPIPPAYSSWGSFNVLAENNRKVCAKSGSCGKRTNAPKGSNEQKIGDSLRVC